MSVRTEKSKQPINQFIYISDSEDDDEGKLIIDETKQISTIKLASIAQLRDMNEFLQKLYADKKIPLRDDIKITNMTTRKTPISVRLQSTLCKPPTSFLQSPRKQTSEENDLQITINSGHQMANESQPLNRSYTNFDIETILGNHHGKQPIVQIAQNLALPPQFPIGGTAKSNGTIYYSITPDYKCSICTASRKYELIPRPHYPMMKPNQLAYSQTESAFKRPETALNLSNFPNGRTPKRLPSYCLMPTPSISSSYKAQTPPSNKRIHPYVVQQQNTINCNGNHTLKNIPAPPPPPPPPPHAPSQSIAENQSILRSIIQPSCYVYPCTIVLSIPILASKFLPTQERFAEQRTDIKQPLSSHSCIHPHNLIDLNSSCHFLLSYGDMRMNMIKFQNSYLRINLLKDFDNSIIDFRTLTKTETLVIRDTVRFSSKWSEFCSLIRSNLLDKESTLLYNHVFQKY